MDAEKLNWVIEPQSSDALFVGRYVEGLYTPLRLSLGELLSLLPVIQPTLTTASFVGQENTTTQMTAIFNVITQSASGAVFALPVPVGSTQCTVANKTSGDITLIVVDSTTIEGETTATIPANTSVTLFFVAGDNTWYAK